VTRDAMLAILAEGAWFNRLSPSFRAALLADGREMRFAAGAPVFWRGDTADGLYAVLDGAVEIGGVDAAGHAATLIHVQPGMWFGEIALIDGMARTHDAIAVRETMLLCVPRGPLFAGLDQRPGHWRELAWLTTEKLRLSFRAAEAASLLSAPQQVATRLMMMVDGYGGTGARHTTLRISQEQLAAMLSLSRQTVNRILKALEQNGVIAVSHSRIDIVNLSSLRKICEQLTGLP
jgi:CRP-like cAMP-binding protein